MASGVKKKSTSIVVWIILLLLVLGLGGFGVSNFGGRLSTIATVGDVEVDADSYYRALQQELRGIQAQTGQTLPLSQAIAFGLDRSVQAQLITAAALDNEARRLGISVGDARVKNEILAVPAFQGISGDFDREAYRFALQQGGQNEAEFEDNIRIETARTLLQAAILNGIAAPDAMTGAFVDFNLERRNFAYIRLDQTALRELVPEPTDTQLETYYQANAADFTEPEKKRLTYVWVTPDMIVDSVDISEDELKSEYENRTAEYSTPERRLVERLVFASHGEAQAAKAQLDSGEAGFEALVLARGLTLLDIDLGDVTLEALDDAGEAVFALQIPGVVGPLDTALGPALFRMNGILAARETSFEDAREALNTELAADRARRQISASITDIDDLLAGGATLEEIAAETDMQLAQIDWSGALDAGIAGYSAFQEAAQAVQQGDFAEVLALRDGGIFALRFDELVAPALNPIDTVMARVIADWEAAEIGARLNNLAQGLQPKFAIQAQAASLGYGVSTQTDILRNANIVGTPAGFVEAVYSMEKGGVKVIDGAGAVYLVRLDDILPPDPDNPDLPGIRADIEGRISQALSQDMFAAFNASLQAEAGVTLNQVVINAVHTQFPQ